MKITKNWMAYFWSLLMLLVVFFPSCGLITNAEEVTEVIYTNVLDDLATDESFSITDYAENLTDYSLSVIQIAESVNNELFIYVYQPTGQSVDLRATHINMSQTDSAEETTIFTLSYINSYETLYKYKVNNLEILADALRYYNITSIYRTTIEGVDTTVDYEDQEITYISYTVGQCWQAYTYEDDVLYSYYAVETIEITDKYVGYCKYSSDYGILSSTNYDQRSHFVAFSTDHDIDKLFEATVYYDWYTYSLVQVDYVQKVSEDEGSEVVTLYADDYGETSSGGLFSYHKTFTFSRIQTIEEFIEGESDTDTIFFLIDQTTYSVASDEVAEAIGDMQYVLRFVETEYLLSAGSGLYTYKYTDISNVSILRLKFEVDGDVYDLGVVDNMQSEGEEPSNTVETEYDWADWAKSVWQWLSNNWQYIVIGIICVVALIVLAPFIPSILSFLFTMIKLLIKGIVWIVRQIGKGVWWLISSVFDVVNDITNL